MNPIQRRVAGARARHNHGIKTELLAKLSEAELDARVAEMDRLWKQADSLPPDLARDRFAKAQKVRDSIPYPEYQAKLDGYHEQLDALPGTGYETLSVRQSIWEAIGKLKRDNAYPPGMEQVMSAAAAELGKRTRTAEIGRVPSVMKTERGR